VLRSLSQLLGLWSATKRQGRVVMPSDPAKSRRVRDETEPRLDVCGHDDRDLFGIMIAVEDALVNSIKHGNQYDRSKKVQIAYRLLPDRFEIHIIDEGTGFYPTAVPEPTAVENLDRPGGRGQPMMRHYMTEVTFNERGNAVTMCRALPSGKQ